MATEWTNNFNDVQAVGTIQFKIDGEEAQGQTTISVDHFVETDPIDGSVNWKVGDEFTIAGDTTLYSIVSITAGSGTGDAKNFDLVITPATVLDPTPNNTDCTKEDSYKGNQGSAENHLRLRNMGII